MSLPRKHRAHFPAAMATTSNKLTSAMTWAPPKRSNPNSAYSITPADTANPYIVSTTEVKFCRSIFVLPVATSFESMRLIYDLHRYNFFQVMHSTIRVIAMQYSSFSVRHLKHTEFDIQLHTCIVNCYKKPIQANKKKSILAIG